MTNVSNRCENGQIDIISIIRFYWIPIAIFVGGMFNTLVVRIVDLNIGLFLIVLSGVVALFWTVMRLML